MIICSINFFSDVFSNKQHEKLLLMYYNYFCFYLVDIKKKNINFNELSIEKHLAAHDFYNTFLFNIL